MIPQDTLVSTPYSGIYPFIRGWPKWVPEDDQLRIGAYKAYEDIYWSNPDAFDMVRLGDEEPVYVPNAMTVVDTTAHYLLKGLTIDYDGGDPGEASLKTALTDFLARERFLQKFSVAKHAGVIRGDWIIHLTADPLKTQGSRLCINSVDPAAYFPVYSDDDLDLITAVNLVIQFKDSDGEDRVKKLRYWYEGDPEVRQNRIVWRKEEIYEIDEWAEPSATPIRTIIPEGPLPLPIDTIPVYHFKNKDWEGQPFGSSEIRGHEMLLGSINQTVSDEDLALAFQGLGVYVTNAPRPKDPQSGREHDWVVSPALVMEMTGDKQNGTYFDRVKGVESVQPHTDLVSYLEKKLWEATGTSEIARGIVDQTVVQSGIALSIKFLPMAAKIEERDLEGLAVLTNFWYDWRSWMKAYEETTITKLIVPKLGPKLPFDRERIFGELNYMYDRAIIDAEYYRAEVQKLGYSFPTDIAERIKAEAATRPPVVQLPPGAGLNGGGGEKPPKGGIA
jgi:hypothetical protein